MPRLRSAGGALLTTYDTLANAMRAQDAKMVVPPPAMHIPMQQQPVQQQQAKIEPEDK